MRIELPRYFADEFVLDEQRLRAICSTLTNQMALITNANDVVTSFKLRIHDLTYGYEATSELLSIDDVFLQDNGDVWIIQELELKAFNKNHPDLDQITVVFRKYEYAKRFQIDISSTHGFYNMLISTAAEGLKSFFGDKEHYSIRYLIIGSDRDWIKQTSLKLEEKLEKIKSFPTNLTALCLVALAFLAAFFGSILYFTRAFNFTLSIGSIITIYLALLLLFSLGSTMLYGFPPHNFYWGEYKSSLDKRQSRAKSVITVVILGIALSVFGAIYSIIITR